MYKKLFDVTTGIVLALTLLVGCGGSSGGSDGPLTIEQWGQDIDVVVDQSSRIHPNLFHTISSVEYHTAAAELKRDLPSLTRNEIFTRIKKLVAIPATREDGHTVMPMFQATGFRLFPLRLYEFSDGVFVIDANPPYRNAIGQRVVQIGGMDINDINRLIDPLITRDNDTNVTLKRTLHYVVPELLHSLGILLNAEAGDYLLEDSTGNFSTLLIDPIDREAYRITLDSTIGLPQQSLPLYLSNLSERFWLQVIDGGKTLYIKYNLVQSVTQSGMTIAGFSDLIRQSVANGGIDKVVVDVRHNGGGNNATYGPLLDVLASTTINQPNTLYVLIDRLTFSAAANFVTELESRTEAIFVGEMTGGSPNNFGDTISIALPNSGFGVNIPTRYWQFSPGDTRVGIAPDIPVQVFSDDYFRRVDPVLETVLNL